METWKDIPGYEGYYQASDLGNVKSKSRVVQKVALGTMTINEKTLRPQMSSNGYKFVRLYKNCKAKRFKISQLVAMAFLGHVPCGHKIVVDHINNNKLDDRLSNLQLLTNRENLSKDKIGSSKYTGVCWNKACKKWTATITINWSTKFLGNFDDEEEAAKAYQNALKTLVK